MIAEERLYLYGRGTSANGYVGPFGTPANVTLAAVSASVAPSGSTTSPSLSFDLMGHCGGGCGRPSDSCRCHAPRSVYGRSFGSVVSAGQAIQVKVGTDVQGALGYNLFVASVQAGPYYYAGRTGYNVGYITNPAIVWTNHDERGCGCVGTVNELRRVP